jgi:hypothetical protein
MPLADAEPLRLSPLLAVLYQNHSTEFNELPREFG